MNGSKLCQVVKKGELIYSGDIVHPCVRFSKNKFLGYDWWMIYTPYYNNNSKIENPILCFGNSDVDGKPPIKWEYYKQVVSKPTEGYNSDPNMYFDDSGLNIFWRESNTYRTKLDHHYRATYGLTIKLNGEIINYENPILAENRRYFDNEVSASFMEKDNQLFAYAMSLRFKNESWIFRSSFLNKLSNKFLSFLSLLEFTSHIKSYGISIWNGNSLNNSFKLLKTVKFENLNSLYKPWHLDTFNFNNITYAIVQTNKANSDISLAYYNTEIGESFKFYPKPLITCNHIDKFGIYKATGFVQDGMFYLYYTAQDKSNRKLNKMYLTSILFTELLETLDK